ncbi:hypothetical protein HG535_0A04670 [Zygotorulaspora mrakii]|uniref:Uncharacterized protein n=1 Tax=Zygotorulaspora mrakii TaxID=42260 RepID=A0A7H9AWK7_ZYGMR|nr:uncharacterized protein HG535_0A04670 [Zygotorulaspora mrakii]QLG70527.1 hypothetical protein HG535_0A04670 [Zygotorulaspora mrakii]
MAFILPFKQVDVFTNVPFKGNPVAVINCLNITEDQISSKQMQAVANWTNLSETTFIFKSSHPECHYKIRIFTPLNELPLAGHPMIGTCKAFLEFTETKNVSKMYCESKLGVIELSIASTGEISFKAPPADIEGIAAEASAGYQKSLGCEPVASPKLVRVGPKWVVFLVSDAEKCYGVNPDFAKLKHISNIFEHTGLILAGSKSGSMTNFEMRAFAPAEGVDEDPVCGSGSLALTRYLHDHFKYSETTQINITEGGRLGRDGHIKTCVSIIESETSYSTGGDAITIINGTISI